MHIQYVAQFRVVQVCKYNTDTSSLIFNHEKANLFGNILKKYIFLEIFSFDRIFGLF